MKKQIRTFRSGALSRLLISAFTVGLPLPFVLLLNTQTSFAGSATWKTTPASEDWNTAANWRPMTVPNGPADTATFATSNMTQVALSATIDVDGIVFDAGASAFTISTESQLLRLDGAGIINNSGITQRFVVGAPFGLIGLNNNSTLGSDTIYTIEPDPADGRGFHGTILLGDLATAGDATFILLQDRLSGGSGGVMLFEGFCTAGNGKFTINGGAVNSGHSARISFDGKASGGNGTFMLAGGTANNAEGGLVEFRQNSTAGRATLIANGGSSGGLGGSIQFEDSSHGSKARVEVFGNGELDISFHSLGNVAVGSIEGNGNVFLGADNLTVGANSQSTIFSGVIRDGGGNGGIGGSITKIGKSKLVLRHRNTYTGGTTVRHGKLVVNNVAGSGTGTGAVRLEGGKLGGKGIIAGAVTVGTGSGPGAVLSAGYLHGAGRFGALTIQSPLIFNSDGFYEMELNSSSAMADEVVAMGVAINAGAQFSFSDLDSGTLLPGTIFTVINNTSANPIAGTFANLPDRSTFTRKGNTYQVNYEGGDGNDLTLTVAP